jgi:hypothetical protein
MIKALVFSPFISRETAFMLVTHSAFARVGLAALLVAGLVAPAVAQNAKPQTGKLTDQEKKEVQALALLLDAAITTQVPEGASLMLVDPSKKAQGVQKAPDAVTCQWYNDALRAGDGKAFVPFMVLFDEGALPGNAVAVGIRVAPKGTAAPLAPAKDSKVSPYLWEDVAFTELRAATEVAKMDKFARALQVPAGDYDVYLAFRPHSTEKTKDVPYKALVVKHTLSAPDFNGELTTSTLMVLTKIEQLTAPLSPEVAREQPWTMGGMQFVPSIDRQFAKGSNFAVYFQVYNQQVNSGKPDITVEYNFYRKQGSEEKFFNKTAPQNYNANTLPPQWDAAVGHVVTGGVEIPLTSFEPGDYRLEIKATDNLAKKSLTREVNFTVKGA